MTFTMFMDESVEKYKSISSTHGRYEILLYSARKIMFEQEVHFLQLSVLILHDTSKVFQEAISFSFAF